MGCEKKYRHENFGFFRILEVYQKWTFANLHNSPLINLCDRLGYTACRAFVPATGALCCAFRTWVRLYQRTVKKAVVRVRNSCWRMVATGVCSPRSGCRLRRLARTAAPG